MQEGHAGEADATGAPGIRKLPGRNGDRGRSASRVGGHVEQFDQAEGSRRFGDYLRRVREGRRLSLDSVEEMSAGFPERVTKSHLSRIENGQALPTFPRLFALSRIYGVPISAMAERFEVELQHGMTAAEYAARSPGELEAEARRLVPEGMYAEALAIYTAALDRVAEPAQSAHGSVDVLSLRLGRVNCLVHLGRLELAKTETEEILGYPTLTPDSRLVALQFLAICCRRLGRFTVALMVLDHVRGLLERPETSPRIRADFKAIEASVLHETGRDAEAVEAYATALSLYEAVPHPFESCKTRINLAVALLGAGRQAEARRHLEEALGKAESSGYDRLRAWGLSTLAELALQNGDLKAAETYAIRSNAISRPREYITFVFRNCYYLWKIARAKGDEPGVKANERTLRSYVGRVEEALPEVEAFRAVLTGGVA